MSEMNPLQAADPFDPENLRLDQSFVETSGVKKLLTTVPVRKPNNQDFVRVHPRRRVPADIGDHRAERRSRGLFGFAAHRGSVA